MTSIYIAAPWPIRDQALQLCFDICRHTSIRCVSRWLIPGCGQVEGDEWARGDLADVARCDVFVALNPDEWGKQGTGGRHVEFGYAAALRNPIVLIGARTNIFHHLGDVRLVDDAAGAIRAIHRLTDIVPVEGCPSWRQHKGGER